MTVQRSFAHHDSRSVETSVSQEEAFAFADDHRHLSMHMGRRSAMMAGSSMETSFDERGGRGLGATITMRGRMLGFDLALVEQVTEYDPPRRKAWETVGKPRLIVISAYRMGFEVVPTTAGRRLTLFIDYDCPGGPVLGWPRRQLAGWYTRWCLDQMLASCRSALLDQASSTPH